MMLVNIRVNKGTRRAGSNLSPREEVKKTQNSIGSEGKNCLLAFLLFNIEISK